MAYLLLHVLSKGTFVSREYFGLMSFYFLGLILRGKKISTDLFTTTIALIFALIFMKINQHFVENELVAMVVSWLYSIPFILFIFGLGKIIQNNNIVYIFLDFIAYGSLVAYLFHREIYFALNWFLGSFKIWFAYLIALPVLLLVSFVIQKSYDYTLSVFTEMVENKKRGGI